MFPSYSSPLRRHALKRDGVFVVAEIADPGSRSTAEVTERSLMGDRSRRWFVQFNLGTHFLDS